MTNLDDQKLEQHIKDIEVLGYTRIPSFIPASTVALVRDRLEFWVQKLNGTVYPGYTSYRPEDEQVFNLQNKDKLFIDLLGEPAIEKILMHFLNDKYYRALPADAPNYILSELIARSSGQQLGLHIDSWMPSSGAQTWMMQAAFVVQDRTEEDGCTTVVPGSHRRGEYTERNYPNVTPVPVLAGDVLLWDSRLWHGALQRRRGQKSWVVIATVQTWWVKQRFDIVNSLPDSIYATLTDRQRALMGFCSMPPKTEFENTDTRNGYDAIARNRAGRLAETRVPR